jgi:cytidylate kinase
MYRCVGLAAGDDFEHAGEVAERVEIELGERVLLDGRDVTEEIRTAAASEAASHVASDPAVRAALVRKQQAIVASGHWVAEGRDIATVVAPDAAVKVFLTADPEERARRRALDLGHDVEEVLAAQRERDLRDQSGGQRATLEAPKDSVPVDTTGLTLDQVVDQVVTLAIEAKEIEA